MSDRRFSYFVVFAEMRTGSNFLEANINQFSDLKSHGELFNPVFVGGAKKDALFGISLRARQKDPFQLLAAIKADDPGVIPGFRFFHDHDPRILQACLDDPDCGKVILTRNPLDCYVSRKIAGETGQWKLTNIKHQKTAQIAFEADEFADHLEAAQQFQLLLLNGLQTSGQTAFYINYDDIQSVDVLNGLARFLGSGHQVDALDKGLKRQNPADLESKVSNFAEIAPALGKIDFLNLSRTPNYEPRRGAGVPRLVAGDQAPLIFAPIKGAPVDRIKGWMAAHEDGGQEALISKLNQKTLRDWQLGHPGYQSFTVLRHPVARAHHVFCTYILPEDKAAYSDLRTAIIRDYKVAIPKKGAGAGGYDLDRHRQAFTGFLKFLKANLADQSGLRIDAAWASQTAYVQGVSTVLPLGHVLREKDLAASLAYLEALTGLAGKTPDPGDDTPPPFDLAEVYDEKIESRVRDAYGRDYLNFGFGDWSTAP